MAGNTTWFEGHSRVTGLASCGKEGAISMRDRVASVRGNVRKGVGRFIGLRNVLFPCKQMRAGQSEKGSKPSRIGELKRREGDISAWIR